MNNPYQNYFANQIQTASPEQVLVMLYDGAIRFLRQARQALENGDRVGKLKKISRTVAILTELSNSLDFEKGGEIAENLDGLYAYMVRELTRPNAEDEFKAMEVSENILLELRGAWAEAIEKNRSKEEQSPAAAYGDSSDAEPPRKSMNAAV
ncbi:flagellar protein FliS [Desulfosalsimonas propionicica]|uniref:Flagellar secretion chaperone FliS n=1 Tax=Desulfosalsimonas propionicica TaxID=332175 RepID=A0A7W0HM43_9BACT|nr:flagellar export chaperone FliS [Desulfosalsimonas propionicica]MBA2882666.1 flagellar protein FliS [Desulfosalsimonas propionicica]